MGVSGVMVTVMTGSFLENEWAILVDEHKTANSSVLLLGHRPHAMSCRIAAFCTPAVKPSPVE